ncbi:hypothetical protein [Pleionea sediminis]|uniref:hypothetical protein n=1 Tax=Pleionea sediminis TaxID=2569479 RepID=UPI0011859881|nr:hypothetical protein [Pleionea sediminis]
MTKNNVYKPPEAELQPLDSSQNIKFEKVATGQRLIIYAILIYFSAVALRFVIGPFVLIFVLVSLVISIIGVAKMLDGMESHIVTRIFVFFLLFVPLINLLTLLSLNSRASKKLKSAGYTIGLLGAKRPG